MSEEGKKVRISRVKSELEVKADAFTKLSGQLKEVYEATIKVLEEAVSHTSNMPTSLLGMLMYADLLHGGAYRMKYEDLPSNKTPQSWMAQAVWWNPLTRLFVQGSLPEVLMNADVPHVFPKLLSDHTYQAIRDWVGIILTKETITDYATHVSTVIKEFRKGGALTKPVP